MKYLFTGLFFLLSTWGSPVLWAQYSKNAHIYKLDIARAAIHGEYRFVGEWQHKQHSHWSWIGALGFVNATHGVAADATRTSPQATGSNEATPDYDNKQLYDPYPRFRYHSLFAAAYVPEVTRERLLGLTLAGGFRWYFFDDAPAKLYAQSLLSYGCMHSIYLAENPRQTVGTAWGHRPELSVQLGWQFLLGHFKSISIDVAAGGALWALLPFGASKDIAENFRADFFWDWQPALSLQVGIPIHKYR